MAHVILALKAPKCNPNISDVLNINKNILMLKTLNKKENIKRNLGVEHKGRDTKLFTFKLINKKNPINALFSNKKNPKKKP